MAVTPGAPEATAPRTPGGPPAAAPLLRSVPPAPVSSSRPSLRDISRTMEHARPVFIVGEARSGSTLLFRTLLKHPTFAPREENLQESSFVVQAPRAARFESEPPRNLRRFMLGDGAAWADFLASIRPLRPWLRLAALAPTPATRWRLGPAALVARSYAYHAWRARGCGRLLEKTPDHVLHVEELYRSFPEARLLYIHRHPVDVYTSYVRRGQVDPKADWARIGPEEFCDRHRARTRRALLAAERHPGTFRVLRYEEFTAHPARELTRVCRFLGEPADLDAMLSREADPDRVAHWEGTCHLYAGITTDTKDWRDYCPPEVAAVVEDRLAGLMRRLGYDRYTA